MLKCIDVCLLVCIYFISVYVYVLCMNVCTYIINVVCINVCMYIYVCLLACLH